MPTASDGESAGNSATAWVCTPPCSGSEGELRAPLDWTLYMSFFSALHRKGDSGICGAGGVRGCAGSAPREGGQSPLGPHDLSRGQVVPRPGNYFDAIYNDKKSDAAGAQVP
eukprot:scaffold8242_cov99-Isochrysis_galbana.AAC.2